MIVDVLGDALMWNLDVEPCEHVTWGTTDSINELAASIFTDLQAVGWTLVRETAAVEQTLMDTALMGTD